MSLLDFARGPALQIAFAVFAGGVAWRLLSLLLLPWARDKSVARADAPSALMGAVHGFVRHLWPPTPAPRNAIFVTLNSYVFHFGLVVIVLGLAQHILFLRGLIGVQWANLPSGVISAVSVVTLAALVVALAHRLADPVVRLISTFNDYFSWLVVVVPVVSGLLAVSHLGARYETLLAVHILSVALLLIWFPFGKLMHAFLVFLTRSETGILYGRRGAEI
jgi:nitrate reductase gamma subunit